MKKEKLFMTPVDDLIHFVKKIKHAMFCDVPFELENYFEDTEQGKIGAVKCPKCGIEFFILNKK